MSPLRHNLSDKLTGLIHITRAQTHLQSPVAVVEQLHRAEYLKKKKKKKDKPLRTKNPSLQESTGQAGSIIHFTLFYKAWNTHLTETFYSHHTMRCPEAPSTMAEPMFLTAKLEHNPRICHKELKAVYLHYSWVSCPFSLPQLKWHELQPHFLSFTLWFLGTWRNTSFDTS